MAVLVLDGVGVTGVGVAVLVLDGVGVTGVGVAVAVLVGVVLPTYSKAPLSHSLLEPAPLPSTFRVAPRWSTPLIGAAEQAADGPRSIAGLPATSAWVIVVPPLLARVVLRMLVSAVGVVPLAVALKSFAPGVKL